MRLENLMELATDTARKSEIRKRVETCVYNALVTDFGADFTRLLINNIFVGENASKIPSGSIIVDVGDVINKDKMSVGALVEINIKVKQWNDTNTARTSRQAITLDDIDESIKIADELAKKKAEAVAKKKENIAKKIERDKAMRAKAKENKS